ncbi:MAG TPA: NAD(P)H-binding protein [Candidatus Dormibacteraeota bacterium]|nr:NAD(P)H-binding protein [Candidatus Dormibacteraeota bacterium]
MKVVITGANGAVGQAILRCRPEHGAAPDLFVAAVRSRRAAEQIESLSGNAGGVVQISYDDPGSLDAAFQGASAVIHLAGILVERPDSTYEQANVASARSVVEAARRNAVRKLVLVSATGADESSPNRYYRTKGQAEALVRASGLRYTVLRVPLLLGPGTAGAAALRRQVSGGNAKLVGGGRHLQQPLYVDDLARAAVLVATAPSVANNATLNLVGPVSLPERELAQRAARSLGREVRIGSVPRKLLFWMLAIRQRFAGPGFSPDALEVITADTRLDSHAAARELGIQLTGIDEMIQGSLAARGESPAGAISETSQLK